MLTTYYCKDNFSLHNILSAPKMSAQLISLLSGSKMRCFAYEANLLKSRIPYASYAGSSLSHRLLLGVMPYLAYVVPTAVKWKAFSGAIDSGTQVPS